MICRYWRALARPDRADAYVEHLRSDTFPKLARIAGFQGASLIRRDASSGVEFVVLTRWDSIEAIKAFAGTDVEGAVVPEEAQQMMLEYDARVRHYEEVLARRPDQARSIGNEST